MIKFDIEYVDNSIYPLHLIDYLNNLCTQVGLELGSEEIVNGNYQVLGNAFKDNEDCKTVLSNIAQIAGGFAKIGDDNKVYIITLDKDINNYVETIDADSYDGNFTKNNKFGPVNSLIIGYSDLDGENDTKEDAQSVEDNGLTELKILNNQMLVESSEREKIIDDIWENIRDLEYIPFSANYLGYPYLESGDLIQVLDKEDNIHYSYVFNQTFTYNGVFRGEIETKGISKTQTPFKNTIKNKFAKTEAIINKIEETITLLVEENNGLTERVVRQEINIEGINQSIKNIGGNNKQENSVGAFGTEEYEQNENGTILAYETNELKSITASGRAIMISEGKWFKFKSTNLIVGETYTLSFKYSNDDLNRCKISLINNVETVLIETNEKKDLTNFEYTFIALNEYVELYVETGNYSMIITDYYLQSGSPASMWQPATR